MKKHTFTNDRSGALPRCLIQTDHPEIDGMLQAFLADIFSFSGDAEPVVKITSAGDSHIKISAEGAGEITLERPFSRESLYDAVMSIEDNGRKAGFSADSDTLSAVLGDLSAKLTETEFRLFSAILESGDSFISAKELSEKVWGKYDRNLCTVYISYLRRKLDCVFGDGTLITARGKGYRLRNSD